MIPKTIHYCWFGGKTKPGSVIDCINSWKAHCPEYQIVEWNEQNFDVNCCDYVKSAYKEKKWAFVSDYVRLYALVLFGGVYMDTDIYMLKNIDSFLQHEAFSGFQCDRYIQTGLIACEPGFEMFKILLHEYDSRSFYNDDGSINHTPNVRYITDYCLNNGLVLNNKYQNVCGLSLYPMDYFCAKSHVTGIESITKNTHTVHQFICSWWSDEARKNIELKHFMIKKYGLIVGLIVYKIKKTLNLK